MQETHPPRHHLMASPHLPMHMHAGMIMTLLLSVVFISRMSLFSILFDGTEPKPIQAEQATFEEGRSALVIGRDNQK